MLCFHGHFSPRATLSTSTLLRQCFWVFFPIKYLFLPSALPSVPITCFTCLPTPSPEIQAAFSFGCCIASWECSPFCLKCLGFLQSVVLCHEDEFWYHSTVPEGMKGTFGTGLCVWPPHVCHRTEAICWVEDVSNWTRNDLFSTRQVLSVKIIFSYQANTCNPNSD